jgi:2-C-methyl-D-erythritol 4-phosphate cytidylyltransferase
MRMEGTQMISGFKKALGKAVRKNSCSAVIAAAGSSARMGGVDKLFLELGGMPGLAHTLTALSKCHSIRELIVVTRPDEVERVAGLCREYCIEKVTKIIEGGDTRLESVYKGLLQVSPDADLVAIHDGARPFVTEGLVSLVLEAASKYGAAAPAVPVTSTVKQAKSGMVVKTIDRSELFEIQTPQVFASALIKGALQNAVDKSLYITDDCMAVEALGCPVKLTTGARENIKLTTKTDILYAEALFKRREGHENRSRV